MADTDDQGVKTDPTADESGVKDDSVTKDVKDDVRQNPLYERVQDLTAKNKRLEGEMEKIESDRTKVKRAEQEKQGEYKTLLKEVDERLETVLKERDVAVEKWATFEKSEREELSKDLSDDDKAIAAKLELTDMRKFITRIAGNNSTSTDTRRVANNLPEGKLKPIAEMSDKEQFDTHKARLASYD